MLETSEPGPLLLMFGRSGARDGSLVLGTSKSEHFSWAPGGSGPRCLSQTLRYRLKYIAMICKTLKLDGTICYEDKGITRRGWLWKMSLSHETICQCSFSFSSTKLYALLGGKVSNYLRVT